MSRFVAAFASSTGVLILLSIPTLYLAWRKGRPKTLRRLLVAILGTGLLVGVVAASSGHSLDQCQAANGRVCFDSGSAGIRLTIIVIFTLIAWAKAVALWDE